MRGTGRPGSEVTAVGTYPAICLVAALLALTGTLLVRWFPLPSFESGEFLSSYGTVDNRRVLLTYAVCVAAVFAAPPLVLWRRGMLGRGINGEVDEVVPSPVRRRRWVSTVNALAGLAALGVLLVGPGVAMGPIDGHELVHFGYLGEVELGKWLNVDTRITYGPLSGYALYGFMKATSFSLVGFRLYWNVVAAVVLFAVLFLASPRMRSRYLFAVLALYLLVFTLARYYLPDAEGVNGGKWGWGNLLRNGWIPIAILAFEPYLARSTRWWPRALAGAAVIVGAFYAQETAGAGMACLGLLVVLAGWSDKRRLLGRDLVAFAAGGVVGLGLILIPGMLRGSGLEYLDATWRAPGLFLSGAGNLPYPSLWGGGSRGVGHWAFFLLPAFNLFLLLASWARVLRGERGVWMPLALFATLSYLSVLVRADESHLYNVTLTPILLSFLMVDRWDRRRVSGPRRVRRFAALVLLLVPTLMVQPGLVDLVRGAVRRSMNWNPAPPSGWTRVPTQRGGIWVPPDNWFKNPDWRGEDSLEALIMIRELSGGDPVMIFGNRASLYYFLAEVPCAVPYTDLSSQRQTPRDKRIMGAAFRDSKPGYYFVQEGVFRGGERPPGFAYRNLGPHLGFVVFQRNDLPPVALP